MQIIYNPSMQDLKKHDIFIKIVDFLGIEYRPSHIIVDNNNYDKDQNVIEEFRDIAFTWTPDRPRENIPNYLYEIMNNQKCTHLIWLSRKAINFTDILLTWVLSHELRHVFQSRKFYPKDCIRNEVKKLRTEKHFRNLRPSLFSPSEIDAELCALRTVSSLFCEKEGCPLEPYATLLQKVGAKCF